MSSPHTSFNLSKGYKIEQQQALIKLRDSVLAAKLRGKVDNDTPVFTKHNVAQNMNGKAIPMEQAALQFWTLISKLAIRYSSNGARS